MEIYLLMTTILKIPIPKGSLINNQLNPIHYADCYQAEFRTKQDITPESIVIYLLNYSPKWVEGLMLLRNLLVKPFGLQTSNGELPILTISKGKKVSVFEILERTDDEVLLCYTDKHLDACLSVMLTKLHHQHEVTITTTVHYNNNLGRIYFFLIKPFHILIVKTMLIQMIRQLS